MYCTQIELENGKTIEPTNNCATTKLEMDSMENCMATEDWNCNQKINQATIVKKIQIEDGFLKDLISCT